jgi:phosphoribosylformylglycinamidine synthase
VQALSAQGRLLAVHDRSDGGLFATVCEMAFAGHCGVTLNLDMLTIDPHAADWGDFKIRPEQVAVQRNELTMKALFAEEAGVVLQVRRADRDAVLGGAARGRPVAAVARDRHAQRPRRDRGLARREEDLERAARHAAVGLERDLVPDRRAARRPRLRARGVRAPRRGRAAAAVGALTFDPAEDVAAPYVARGARPRVAVLREQGVNSQVEMAAAFDRPASRRTTST